MNPRSLHPGALREWADAITYYLENASGERAADFDTAIKVAVDELCEYPQRFPRWKRTYIRKCVVFNYPFAIYYVDYPDHIRVLAIAHTSRQPGYWKSRIAD